MKMNIAVMKAENQKIRIGFGWANYEILGSGDDQSLVNGVMISATLQRARVRWCFWSVLNSYVVSSLI